jgi:hypothetical protein
MTKYPEPYADLNPTVAVKVESVGSRIDVSPVTLLEMTIGVMERAYRDFTVTEGVMETTVDGLEAAYMKADHLVMDTEGTEYASSTRKGLRGRESLAKLRCPGRGPLALPYSGCFGRRSGFHPCNSSSGGLRIAPNTRALSQLAWP